MSKAFAGLKAVHELRFHLCQTSKHSEGARNFLLKSYEKLKAASPTTPVLIREAHGVEPKLFARYGKMLFLLFVCPFVFVSILEEEEVEEERSRPAFLPVLEDFTLTSFLFANNNKIVNRLWRGKKRGFERHERERDRESRHFFVKMNYLLGSVILRYIRY